jgi:hypothetical protein
MKKYQIRVCLYFNQEKKTLKDSELCNLLATSFDDNYIESKNRYSNIKELIEHARMVKKQYNHRNYLSSSFAIVA